MVIGPMPVSLPNLQQHRLLADALKDFRRLRTSDPMFDPLLGSAGSAGFAQ
jgi:hypothetical protein